MIRNSLALLLAACAAALSTSTTLSALGVSPAQAVADLGFSPINADVTGVTDGFPIFQALTVPAGHSIYVPAGTYRMSVNYSPPDNVPLFANGAVFTGAGLGDIADLVINRSFTFMKTSTVSGTDTTVNIEMNAKRGSKTGQYQKSALFVRATQNEGSPETNCSASTNTTGCKDIVGGTFTGNIGANVQHGRTYAQNITVGVPAGSTGQAVGAEIDVANNTGMNTTGDYFTQAHQSMKAGHLYVAQGNAPSDFAAGVVSGGSSFLDALRVSQAGLVVQQTTSTSASTTTVIGLASSNNVTIGEEISGTGVPPFTIITTIRGLTITTDRPVNIANNAVLTFNGFAVRLSSSPLALLSAMDALGNGLFQDADIRRSLVVGGDVSVGNKLYARGADVHGSVKITGDVVATTYRETLTTPPSATSACSVGQFTDDESYHYVCTAPNVWKRGALVSYAWSGPKLSGAGSGATLSVGGEDSHGTVTEGASATGFTLTFSVATANPRDCVVSSPNASAFTAYSVTTTALTLKNAAASGAKFTYWCSSR